MHRGGSVCDVLWGLWRGGCPAGGVSWRDSLWPWGSLLPWGHDLISAAHVTGVRLLISGTTTTQKAKIRSLGVHGEEHTF